MLYLRTPNICCYHCRRIQGSTAGTSSRCPPSRGNNCPHLTQFKLGTWDSSNPNPYGHQKWCSGWLRHEIWNPSGVRDGFMSGFGYQVWKWVPDISLDLYYTWCINYSKYKVNEHVIHDIIVLVCMRVYIWGRAMLWYLWLYPQIRIIWGILPRWLWVNQ